MSDPLRRKASVSTTATSPQGSNSSSTRKILFALVAVLVVIGAVALTRSGTTKGKQHHGVVDVLYAGSLTALMETKLGPAFHRATGYTIQGVASGSKALAAEIKSGLQVGDVFVSASPKVDASLQGSANGNWVTRYTEFGTSSLLLGYNPSSRFAARLRSRPWYDVITLAGFLLGRTDPATDPKGVLTVKALTAAAAQFQRPALLSLTHSSSNVFAETSLVGELQAGQLDAGFFYAVEASAAHLSTIALTGVDLSAHYTVAVLRGAPHRAAARAFAAFVVSGTARRILAANGLTPVVPPIVHGS